MQIWSDEIKELESLYTSIKGRFPELEKDLEHLIKTDDENVALLYSRRCLEIIITDLCECELKRPRKTEPLKGIIDKLHREEKVPSHIITSMDHLDDREGTRKPKKKLILLLSGLLFSVAIVMANEYRRDYEKTLKRITN